MPLADGIGDDAYLQSLAETLVPMLDNVAPDLILYQAGVDPFEGDRLGRLNLTHEGLARRERFLAGLARSRGIPLASALGGGYGHDAMEVSRRHVASILTLGSVFDTSATPDLFRGPQIVMHSDRVGAVIAETRPA